MVDISMLCIEDRAALAGAYLHVTYRFGIDPLGASAKQQRKMRSYISNQYIELAHSSQEVSAIFSTENNDYDFWEGLHTCFEEQKQHAAETDTKLKRDLATLGEAEVFALKKLLQIDCMPEWSVCGADIRIVIDDTPAFQQTLILRNVDAAPEGKEGWLCQNLGIVLKKEERRFCFYGETEDVVEEMVIPFAMTFDGVAVEVDVYNACNNLTFWDDPWDFLRATVFGIDKKSALPGSYCNDEECKLLPLIREVVALEYWVEVPGFGQTCLSFPELKAAVHRYGFAKAEKLLEKLEMQKPMSSAYDKTARQLKLVLCKKQCEPLWREIYTAVAASQEGYPNKVELLCDELVLADARRNIQVRMEANGYRGNYPDFVKDGAISGIHLEQSYDRTYFVGMEKRVRHHIHCFEALEDGRYLMIQFLCGTAFLKKNEGESDVYGCLFDANGRRLFRTMHHDVALQNEDDTQSDDWDMSVSIAVKKAECKRLNKEEKREYYGLMLPGWKTFFGIFFVAGGMFSVVLIALFMLVCAVITAAVGLASDIPEMMREMPWGGLLALSWVGFGVAMGITEILARRK